MRGKFHVCLTQCAVLQITQVFVSSNRTWALTSGRGVWRYTILLHALATHMLTPHISFLTHMQCQHKRSNSFSFIAFPILVLPIRPHRETCCLPSFVTPSTFPIVIFLATVYLTALRKSKYQYNGRLHSRKKQNSRGNGDRLVHSIWRRLTIMVGKFERQHT